MLVSSLLCSSDVIAAISIIKYDEQPRLFSLVFGEGIVNDAVAIILFTTISGFVEDNNATFTASTPFVIFGDFLLLTLISISIGVGCGLLASFLLKHLRFITTSSVKESMLIFSFGYIAYGIGEVLH